MTSLKRGSDAPAHGLPAMLRVCGYRSRRIRPGRWIGYCLELHLREEGRDWEDLQERLLMAASLRLEQIRQKQARPMGRAPLKMRLLYAYIAIRHFLRPTHHRRLADVSSGLLVSQ